MICALYQEPFWISPEQIANLTDYQIVHCLLLPAARRAEEQRRKIDKLPPLASEEESLPVKRDERKLPPTRAQHVFMLMTLGMKSVDDANRDYDLRLARWKNQFEGN